MAGRTRQHWPDEVKRRVVVETYAEGASVAEVALRYGINANLVFIWRKDRRFNSRLAGADLVPVEITPDLDHVSLQPQLKARPDVPAFDTESPNIEIVRRRPGQRRSKHSPMR